LILDNQVVYYSVAGMNFKKFLLAIQKEGLEVYNFIRLDFRNFVVGIRKKDEKLFLEKAKKYNYELSVNSQSLLLKSKSKILQNLAMVLCVFVLLISLAISYNFVFKVEVLGCSEDNKTQIIKVLNKNDITTFKPKSFYNLTQIASIIKKENNNISYASAIIRGNTIVINVKEKIDNSNIVYDYKPIVAPFNLIIKNVDLFSGTLLVSSGQTVKKGDVIVSPYISYKDGTNLKVKASAKIEAYIEVSNSTNYLENHSQLVKTGKTFSTRNLLLYNKVITKQKVAPFKYFSVSKTTTYPFKNFILPLKQENLVYYELQQKQVFVPIDKALQNIIEQNKKVLYNMVGDVKVLDTPNIHTTVDNIDNSYLVTTYFKANIIF